MASQRPRVEFTSPRGIAGWTYITEPDARWVEKGQEPQYRTDLLLRADDQETQAFRQKLLDIAQRAYDWAREYKPEWADAMQLEELPMFTPDSSLLEDGENPSDWLAFKFKLKAVRKLSGGRTAPQAPALYDSRGQPLPKSTPRIGRGSILRVAGAAFAWTPMMREVRLVKDGKTEKRSQPYCGIKLSLDGVQVIELRSAGRSTSAEGFGFSTVSDGYTAAEEYPFGSDEETAFLRGEG